VPPSPPEFHLLLLRLELRRLFGFDSVTFLPFMSKLAQAFFFRRLFFSDKGFSIVGFNIEDLEFLIQIAEHTVAVGGICIPVVV